MRGSPAEEWRRRGVRFGGFGGPTTAWRRRRLRRAASTGWAGPIEPSLSSAESQDSWSAHLRVPSRAALTPDGRPQEGGRAASPERGDPARTKVPGSAGPGPRAVADRGASTAQSHTTLQPHISRLLSRAQQLTAELQRARGERAVARIAREALDELLHVVGDIESDELDPWFLGIRGIQAVDFLISLEPHRNHSPAELCETMLANGWMRGGLKAPLETARAALNRLVREGLAVRVAPGRYRTTRTRALLYEMDID